MSRSVNYFVRDTISVSGEFTELVQLASRYTPTILGAIEGRKGRSFWVNSEHYVAAYTSLCEQQAEILMGAKEEVIREIRGIRGHNPPIVADDLVTYPVGTYPGVQLKDIHADLNDGGMSVAIQTTLIRAQLEEIKLALQAEAMDMDTVVANLDSLLLLLAV